MNQLLGNNSVTVILQWPREPGAIYHVNIKPETPHNEFITDHHNIIVVTISYNIQYNVSIESSLCGITTTKVLNYGRYDSSNNCILSVTIIFHLSSLAAQAKGIELARGDMIISTVYV